MNRTINAKFLLPTERQLKAGAVKFTLSSFSNAMSILFSIKNNLPVRDEQGRALKVKELQKQIRNWRDENKVERNARIRQFVDETFNTTTHRDSYVKGQEIKSLQGLTDEQKSEVKSNIPDLDDKSFKGGSPPPSLPSTPSDTPSEIKDTPTPSTPKKEKGKEPAETPKKEKGKEPAESPADTEQKEIERMIADKLQGVSKKEAVDMFIDIKRKTGLTDNDEVVKLLLEEVEAGGEGEQRTELDNAPPQLQRGAQQGVITGTTKVWMRHPVNPMFHRSWRKRMGEIKRRNFYTPYSSVAERYGKLRIMKNRYANYD